MSRTYEDMTWQGQEMGEGTHLDTFFWFFLQVLQFLGNLLDDSGGQRLCSLQLATWAQERQSRAFRDIDRSIQT